jgi:hypothetical protein
MPDFFELAVLHLTTDFTYAIQKHKGNNMSKKLKDEDIQKLNKLLKTKYWDWDSACGMPRPSFWQFWKFKAYKIMVEATKEAIRASINHKNLEDYIPRVEIENNTLIVYQWGNPLNRADYLLWRLRN